MTIWSIVAGVWLLVASSSSIAAATSSSGATAAASTSSISTTAVILLGLLAETGRPQQILDRNKMNPCKFNPRCMCSNNGDDLGAVECSFVPLADIPPQLADTRVFALALRNNGLRQFPDAKLYGMGSWSLEVSSNLLTDIPSLAFSGLERSMWTLILKKNKLTRIPYDSISRLQKLNVLDLSDNHISDISALDLKSLSSSLETLLLSGNCLVSVPEGIFWGLKRLKSLDLSRNNILNIHSMAFQNGLVSLSNLNLGDNLLAKIPYTAISSVKTLKILDFSKNRVESIADTFAKKHIKLDTLLLDQNNIRIISKNAFQNFNWINLTSFRGNPIHAIHNDAFLDTQIRKLDLHNCHISTIQPRALRGLQRCLEVLDLSSNRIARIPQDLFDQFDNIKSLKLNNNRMSISPNMSFNGFRYTIESLDLEGENMRYVPLEEMGVMRNLRTVGIAAVRDYGNLRPSQFQDFSPGLEELNLVDANIVTIRNNAFYHIPSISRMDLSDNRVRRIDVDAFRQIGNSLKFLKMSNALQFQTLPSIPFQSLSVIEHLDLSDNHITTVPIDTFHKMNRLTKLYLQHNDIETFRRGTFHSQANPRLQVLDLSFNRIKAIEYDMFRFESLQSLHLDDNRISKIDQRSFVEMRNLKYLSLEGNRMMRLPDEAFQNLHVLQNLNLGYNRIDQLNFDAFDSVGSLSFLRLDISHNRLVHLRSNKSTIYSSSNIRSLDLSYNNVSKIESRFFEPIFGILKILNLSNNKLMEVTAESLGRLRKLHSLDLSRNQIENFEETTLELSRDLQILNLADNHLTKLSPTTFQTQRNLQVLDLSGNLIESLPESLFDKTLLEIFTIAFNKLTEIPVKSLNPVQSTLKHLNLSGNRISIISESQLNQIQQLVVLDLSHNQIHEIDLRAFCCLPSLLHVSVSHNPIQSLPTNMFDGVKSKLEFLDLSNSSLTILPGFHLPRLLHLNMSHNRLTFVPPATLSNMSSIRTLDLSHNELPNPPHNVWHIMPRLRTLTLSHNPIRSISNESFLSLDRLQSLDISNMEVRSYEAGSLGTMPHLRHLRISVGKPPHLNLASLLSHNVGLQHLHLVLESGDLRHQLQDTLSSKLTKITIEAERLPILHAAALKHLNTRNLELVVKSDSMVLERDLFLNLGQVQNLSLDVSGSVGPVNQSSADVGNPATKYKIGVPNSVFLKHLRLGQKSYTCTCDNIGWIEKWVRRWRGIFCGGNSDIRHSESCDSLVRDLRTSRCAGSDSSVLEDLKYRLNCNAFNSAPTRDPLAASVVTATVSLFFTRTHLSLKLIWG